MNKKFRVIGTLSLPGTGAIVNSTYMVYESCPSFKPEDIIDILELRENLQKKMGLSEGITGHDIIFTMTVIEGDKYAVKSWKGI